MEAAVAKLVVNGVDSKPDGCELRSFPAMVRVRSLGDFVLLTVFTSSLLRCKCAPV